jgi:xanthine dehydrogenase accessory factor
VSAQLIDAQAWLGSGRPAIVVSVVAAQGSTPRTHGTCMIVGEHRVIGTIGGGHLEDTAIRLAREQLRLSASSSFEQQWALGPSLGQCCGGVMRLRFETLEAQVLARWPESPLRFKVQLYGAGHVGRALVQALLPLPGQVRWVESRSSELDLFLPVLHAHPQRNRVELVLVDDPIAEVPEAAPDAIHLVMTHSHSLDLELVSAILRLPHAPVCGLIGSQTKKVRFQRNLERRAISTRRLVCPIGLPGLSGKEPEVIAASVAAQILMGQWPHELTLDDTFAARTAQEPVSESR